MRKRILWHVQMGLFILACSISVGAQFNSGSTGADGALDLSNMNCPNNRCIVQLPESGVLNYTTVNIPAQRSLVFKRNSRNTSVILLATGDIVIDPAGSINVSAPAGWVVPVGDGKEPGPGGFWGGTGTSNGFGPGGGTLTRKQGIWVGPLTLNPLVGGSGGYGDNGQGGGGGGAIVLASSTSITIGNSSGFNILASGGVANPFLNQGTLGSGGVVRLVANTLNVSGRLFACNWFDNPNAPVFNCGVIKLEALQGQLNYSGQSSPSPVLAPFQSGNPPVIFTNDLPALRITEVGGYTVPPYAGTRFDTADLLLPNSIPDPVSVTVSATNIPVNSEVRVGFLAGSSGGTTTPCNLVGTFSSSSCVATISNLNRGLITYLLATVAFDPPSVVAKFNPKGKDKVSKIRLEMILGAKPKYSFLDSKGNSIPEKNISREFLAFFGI